MNPELMSTEINSIDHALVQNQAVIVEQVEEHRSNSTNETATIEVEDFHDDGFTTFHNDVPYFLSATRRILSADNCVGFDIEPEYFLLVAFSPPLLLEIAKQQVATPEKSLHWTSHITTKSRLSGWKESNTIYSQFNSQFS
ncbi:hypothetical protein L4D20_20940 [Vibrio kyushuensis]|uniref:hypothetical protein n=1 Tax=Vibrio kyushuensis TaxID=2910249 RepID=UPI003D0B001A